jgi:hypothetical protein
MISGTGFWTLPNNGRARQKANLTVSILRAKTRGAAREDSWIPGRGFGV